MDKIDAHQHFWHPARGDYGWMPEDDPILSRPYHIHDLKQSLQSTQITQTVLVQAAPSIEETEYLLGIADTLTEVAKVVGWINFEIAEHKDTLKRLSHHPKFSGVRPMIQDLPDDNWMLREDVQWAYQALIDLDLTFDCLGFPRHLDNFHQLLKKYPKLRAVVDHCLKPQFRHHNEINFSHWSNGIERIAKDTNAYCKLSGLVTEADTDWSYERIKPYTDHVLHVFGPDRVMWGSDWPVVNLKCDYQSWHELALALIGHLPQQAIERVMGGTAADFYRIEVTS